MNAIMASSEVNQSLRASTGGVDSRVNANRRDRWMVGRLVYGGLQIVARKDMVRSILDIDGGAAGNQDDHRTNGDQAGSSRKRHRMTMG